MKDQSLTVGGGQQLVLGLGKSGLSMVENLLGLGADVAVMDSRAEPPGLAEFQARFPMVPCYLGEFSIERCQRASRLLLSPGIPLSEPAVAAAVAAGVPLWGDIELFARQARAPVAAITGSNGKSTVTALLGEMAHQAGRRVAVGGNLGTPALALLAEPEVELYVLELSSFQLETTWTLAPTVASVLNISPDHLDRHTDLTAYSAAKQRIFQCGGCQVLNADDPVVRGMVDSRLDQRYFTLDTPRYANDFGVLRQSGGICLSRGAEPWLAASALGLVGDHNIANALAALAMGDVLGLPREAMIEALRNFRGLAHRSQLVAEYRGVRWINDSKATNVGATVAAIRGMSSPTVLIAGGEGKGQDFAPLGPALLGRARAVVVLGRDADQIAAVVPETIPVHRTASMAQAVETAASLAETGDCVLLSPACASFDMFGNFEERGVAFTTAVRRCAAC